MSGSLIEDLRQFTYWCGSSDAYAHDIHPTICSEAADALEQLQADNEMLKNALHECHELQCKNEQLVKRNKKIQAELARVRDNLECTTKRELELVERISQLTTD